jgi:hypothetical protein
MLLSITGKFPVPVAVLLERSYFTLQDGCSQSNLLQASQTDHKKLHVVNADANKTILCVSVNLCLVINTIIKSKTTQDIF